MSATYRQILFTGPRRAECVTRANESPPLGSREVRGATLASLVSSGTEMGVYRTVSGETSTGYAAVFRVDEIGSDVTEARPGDVAFTMGPHRSFQRCNVADAVPVPPRLEPRHAVFARLMGVTMSTLTTTEARPPSKVILSGLGPVGHLGARIFASAGYDVIGIDPDERRRGIAEAAGFRTVMPRIPLDDPKVRDQVTLVVECSGHEQAVLDACRVVRKRGEVVLVGVPWVKKTDITAHELLREVFHRYVVLRSGWEWEVPVHPEEFRVNSILGNIAAAMDWIAEGRIEVSGLYETVLPEKATDVYRMIDEGATSSLAVVFDWATS